MAYIKTFKPFPNSLVESGLESRVGNTPLLPLRRVAEHLPDGVQLFAKAQWFNPRGSVKDPPALNIIQRADAGGELRTSKGFVDAPLAALAHGYAALAAASASPVHARG